MPAKSLHRALPVVLFLAVSACDSRAEPVAELPPAKVDLPAGKPGELQTAVFAGGCFWCTEAVCQQVKGVVEVVSGYAGGSKETATYEQVSRGNTGHAEAIKVTYDPAQITYAQLLRIYFDAHEPIRLNAQGPDVGPQYRSAIFYENEDQKRVAEAYIEQINASQVFMIPIVTTLEDLNKSGFYPAEDVHQDYADRHPDQAYIRANVPKKLKRLKERHGAFYRDPATTRPTP